MSQIGTIISVAPQLKSAANDSNNGVTNWNIMFTYLTDAGSLGEFGIVVGSGSNATVAPWSSPTSSITVSPNPPGTTNPILLPCPDIVAWATFGKQVKGLPFA